jgi:hypothetical protein
MTTIEHAAAEQDVLAEPKGTTEVATMQAGGAPATIQEGPGALLAAIVSMAKDPSVDADKLEKLLAMQERMEDRAAEREFNAALYRIQSKLQPLIRSRTVSLERKDGTSSGSYKFLPREDLDEVLRPLLEAEGFALSFSQTMGAAGGLITTAKLRHRLGHSEVSQIELPRDTGPGRNPLQAGGSTVSYSARYLEEMIFRVVRKNADDDGVLGGTTFVTQEQADELRAMAKDAKQEESRFLIRMASTSGGEPARSYEEVDARDFTRLANTLRLMIDQQKKKAAQS